MIKSREIRSACLLLLFVCTGAAGDQQRAPLVLVLSTQESDPYRTALTAFEQHLGTYYPDARYRYHLVPPDNVRQTLSFLPAGPEQAPSIVLGLGTRAIETARQLFPDTPLVASMILKDKESGPPPQYRSILLQIPATVQLEWLARFLPDVRKVGILYDPEQSGDLIAAFQAAARDSELDIVPVRVNSVAQLQTGLQQISKQADALLAIPDPTAYSGKTAKEVLLFAYRHRIPFVGLSSTWVEAGALYALECDYAEIGRRCAESAREILAGKPLAPPAALSAAKVTFTVNRKTAQHMHLDLDPRLLSAALEVFR